MLGVGSVHPVGDRRVGWQPLRLPVVAAVGIALMVTSWLMAPQDVVVGVQRVEVATFESHDPTMVPSGLLLSNAQEVASVRAGISARAGDTEVVVSIESVDGRAAIVSIRGEGSAPDQVVRDVADVTAAYVAGRRLRLAGDVPDHVEAVRDELVGLRSSVAAASAARDPDVPDLDVLVPWLTDTGPRGPELDSRYREDAFARTVRLLADRRSEARLAWLGDIVSDSSDDGLAERIVAVVGGVDISRFPPPLAVGWVVLFVAGAGLASVAGLVALASAHPVGRVVVVGIVLVAGGWLVAIAVVAIGVAGDAREAVDAARSLELALDGGDLDLDALAGQAGIAEDRLASLAGGLSSPLLAPLSALPTVGGQLDSIQNAVAIARWSSGAASRIAAARPPGDAGGAAWATALESLRTALRDAEVSSLSLPTVTASSFPGRLGDEVAELLASQDRAMALVRDADAAFDGFGPLLRGEGRYLIVAGNNAEMRNNTAAFLMVGEVSLEGGRPSVGRLLPRGQGVDVEGPTRGFPPVERGVVGISEDMRRNWGFFGPDVDINFLGMTGDFSESAAMFAEMWTVVFGEAVDGVVYMDTRALVDLATAGGPVPIDGEPMAAPELLDELLLRQYEIEDRFERQSRLIEITEDVVGSVVDRSSLSDLLPAFRRLVEDRHVMVWAAAPSAQHGLERLGLAGTLTPATLGVGFPALAGKNDHLLSVSVAVQVTCGPETAEVDVRVAMSYPVDVDIAKTDNSDWSWWGEPDLWYVSMPSVRVPIGASDVQLIRDPARAAVREGRTQIVTTSVVLAPGAAEEVRVVFSVPMGSELRVLPDARAVPTPWSLPESGCVTLVPQRRPDLDGPGG